MSNDQDLSERDLSGRGLSNLGLCVYGLGSLAAGIFDLIWRDFDASHQPIQAWGDNLPGVAILACITGIWMAAGALALLGPRTERAGGAALAGIYFVFAMFWLPRFYTAPHYLGVHVRVYIGVFGGMASQLIAFAAGVLLWASPADTPRPRALLLARCVFGLSAIAFGIVHLTYIQMNLEYVPNWMPIGREFWVIATGICFMLSGLAILTGILDVLAAWLLGLMFLAFNLTILPTYILTYPRGHAAWGGNAYNLAAVGASWILADALARGKQARQAIANPPA
jgi:uncharacterized membrane protein